MSSAITMRIAGAGLSRVSGPALASPPPAPSVAIPPSVKDRAALATLAGSALDGTKLGAVRGGFAASGGFQLNFSFQQSTYVDNKLVRDTIIPTITVQRPLSGTAFQASVGSAKAAAAVGSLGTSTVTVHGGQAGMAAVAGQSSWSSTTLAFGGQAAPAFTASGLTSITSSIGGGGLTNVLSNTANNQLVQQLTRINLDVTGLTQLLRQTASPAVARLGQQGGLFR